MTELLNQAIARIRERPPEDQDRAAELLLGVFDRDETDYVLTPEQVEKVRRTQEGLRNGTVRIVPDDEMEEFWRKLGV